MRTIIDLPENQAETLGEICERLGISRAEAIRRAIELYTRGFSAQAAEGAFGLWKDRPEDGLAYERRIRHEWREP